MNDAFNRKKFNAFRERCHGAGITAIHVQRSEAPREVRLRYNAREPRTGRLFNGEWVIEKGGPDVDSREKAFFELAQKHFAVTRHEG